MVVFGSSSGIMLASSFRGSNLIEQASRPLSSSIKCFQQHVALEPAGRQASCPRSKTNNNNNKQATEQATSTTTTTVEAKPFEAIPGPKPSLPVIGTGWIYLPLIGRYNVSRMHEAKFEQNKLYGSIMREQFSSDMSMVTIFEPSDIREVFKAEEGCPSRPVQEYSIKQRQMDQKRYSSVGLANMMGQEWAETRKILAPLLMSSDIKRRIAVDQDRISNRLVDYMNQKVLTSSKVVDSIQLLLSRYAIESITNLTISDKLTCLDVDDQNEQKAAQRRDGETIFAASIDYFKASHSLHYGSKLWKYIETRPFRDLKRSSNIMADTAAIYIDQLVKELEANREQVLKKPISEHKSVTETLFVGQKLSLLDIKSTVTDFIAGGIYTISSTLAMTLFLLATNPDCQEKLYSELKQQLGKPGKTSISLDQLEQLKYLKLCLKEAFRLLPTIPGVARTLQKDMVLAGYQVPKGTLVFCNTLVTCRLAEHFDRPMSFDPGRWDRATTGGGASKSDLVFALLPFGHGIRKCIGRPFAELELQMAIAKLVGEFKIEPVDETTAETLPLDTNFIVVPRNPIPLKFTPRDRQ